MSIRYGGKNLRISGIKKVSINGHTIYEAGGTWTTDKENLEVSFTHSVWSTLEGSNSYLTLYDSENVSLGTYNYSSCEIPLDICKKSRSALCRFSVKDLDKVKTISLTMTRIDGTSKSDTKTYETPDTSGIIEFTISLDGTYNNFVNSVKGTWTRP